METGQEWSPEHQSVPSLQKTKQMGFRREKDLSTPSPTTSPVNVVECSTTVGRVTVSEWNTLWPGVCHYESGAESYCYIHIKSNYPVLNLLIYSNKI